MKIKTIASRRVGSRTIAGTEWPVELVLERSPRDWQVYLVCNGAVSQVRRYRTRWAAWDAYETQRDSMRAVCAWCGADLGARPGPAGTVTHGICATCREQVRHEKETRREPA